MVDSLLFVVATLTAGTRGCKHMFDTDLDIERSFAHHPGVARTYVRRRIAASLLAGSVLVIALTGPVAAALGSGEAPSPAARHTYVVRPGDTLWGIARRVAPATDPRVTVLAIEHANGVDGSTLRPGDVLRITTGT
jgi:nucleoid-associated protein YgaU